MIKSDFHSHSNYSGDSTASMELMVQRAIDLKLDHLCITEHHDIDMIPAEEGISFLLDFDSYIKEHSLIKDKYANDINLLLGIEIGIQSYLIDELSSIINKYPFDFVICSSHIVAGMDPYFPDYFQDKTQKEAYSIYFEYILKNLKLYKNYDVYGHLDYIIRYGNYSEKTYCYKDYSDIFDEILKTIINNGKGIELNTSGYRYGLGQPHPSLEIIEQYKKLGGEIITIGSDAHVPEQLCNNFELAESVLKKAGFKYYSVFRNRTPEFIKL